MNHRNLTYSLIVILLGTGQHARSADPPATGESDTVTRQAVDDIVTAGDWSDEVDGLRGRLVIAHGRPLDDGKSHETVAYVELRYRPDAVGNARKVYFNPNVNRELQDAKGQLVPLTTRGRGFGGGIPVAEWVSLPYDSTMRLRLSPFAHNERGVCIDVNLDEWDIKPTDTSDYFVSGTFTSNPPEDPGHADVWRGSLKLRSMRVSTKLLGLN
jgi:hypothetical protein